MLYELFSYLNKHTDLPGMRVGEYLSFRAGAAIIVSLLIAIFFGKYIIRILRRKQIGEDIRDLGLEGQLQKKGTPTMGGIIIILSVLVPVLLFGDLSNVYIQLMLITTVWLGFIGGLDDYIKGFRHNKEGLKGRFKVFGQVGLGIIVGTTMWLSSDIVIHEKVFETKQYEVVDTQTGNVVDTVSSRNVIPLLDCPSASDALPISELLSRLDICNFSVRKSKEFSAPIRSKSFTGTVLSEFSTADLIVTLPAYFPFAFDGHGLPEIVDEGVSSTILDQFMILFSNAGTYIDNGFIADPDGRFACVA